MNLDDIIYLAAGTYLTGGSNFSYSPDTTPPEENFGLTILGPESGSAILDGQNNNTIFSFMTVTVSDDTESDLILKNITFQNGSAVSGIGGLHSLTNFADIEIDNCEFFNNQFETFYFRTH